MPLGPSLVEPNADDDPSRNSNGIVSDDGQGVCCAWAILTRSLHAVCQEGAEESGAGMRHTLSRTVEATLSMVSELSRSDLGWCMLVNVTARLSQNASTAASADSGRTSNGSVVVLAWWLARYTVT